MRWLITAIIPYIGGMAIWFIIGWLTGDHFWWMFLLNRYASLLFLPAIPCLVVALWSRNVPIIGLSVIPGVLFLHLYWPYLLPQFSQPIHTSNFSVLTYNVLYDNKNYAEVSNMIGLVAPDLIALQEVQPDLMHYLQSTLRDSHPYSFLGNTQRYGTTAIFSRTPFEQSPFILDLEFGRPAVVVQTQIRGDEVTFISAHLLAYGLWGAKLRDWPMLISGHTQQQNRQAEILVQFIKQQSGTILMGCDCNSSEQNHSYQLLSQEMQNAAHASGWLVNSRHSDRVADRDLLHIDYIWYKGLLEPNGVFQIDEMAGSDHQPVLARFRFGSED